MKNILLGVTGSVAAVKTREVAEELAKIGDVRVVLTGAGRYFLEKTDPDFLAEWRDREKLFTDADEWTPAFNLGDPVLHIELRRWASCLVIAPLDANTIAKCSLGLCDNLLTSVFRAWDWTKPVVAAPAMNTMMWENEPTQGQLALLRARHRQFHVVPPVEKRLACNDVGMGAMAPVAEIVKATNDLLRWRFPLGWCAGIPINHHPGAWGFHRAKNHHTGVDLYTVDGAAVYAVEDGTVVKVDVFTGPKAGHDWWEETYGIMVEGASGVVNYGEVAKPESIDTVVVGQKLNRGERFARVKRVLFEHKLRPDIPGHSTSMLHLELYKAGTREFADWHDPQKNPALLDPTPMLLAAENAPAVTLTWGNEEARTVG
jgi:phosphopantothenoylcysteine decarboxylase